MPRTESFFSGSQKREYEDVEKRLLLRFFSKSPRYFLAYSRSLSLSLARSLTLACSRYTYMYLFLSRSTRSLAILTLTRCASFSAFPRSLLAPPSPPPRLHKLRPLYTPVRFFRTRLPDYTFSRSFFSSRTKKKKKTCARAFPP